jgi:hypothetical protein
MLNVIALVQREIDNINQKITISNRLLIQIAYLLVILDLVNPGQIDHTNQTITFSVITLHYSNIIVNDECKFLSKIKDITLRTKN